MMDRWLFSHRHREALAAWERYKTINPSGPDAADMPPLFAAGFHMGVGAVQRTEPAVAAPAPTNDPEPWRCVDFRWTSNHEPLGAPCRSATQSYHNCQFDPRPEYDSQREVEGADA